MSKPHKPVGRKLAKAWEKMNKSIFDMAYATDSEYMELILYTASLFNNEIQYTRECDYVRGDNG